MQSSKLGWKFCRKITGKKGPNRGKGGQGRGPGCIEEIQFTGVHFVLDDVEFAGIIWGKNLIL